MVMWTWRDEYEARNNAGVAFTDTVKHSVPYTYNPNTPDFPAIHPYDQETRKSDWFKEWVDKAVSAEKNEKKELRFSISAFPTPNNKRDNIVFIYLWNGKDWVWDGNKDDVIGTLERYPLKQWEWSSVDE